MTRKKIKNKLAKSFIIFLSVVSILCIALFTKTDTTPYKKTGYYKEMVSRLDSIPEETIKGEYFKAGWAKENITPNNPLPIASYGIRKNNLGVHDSLWVRTFVFDNGVNKVAMVTMDLLIFPPEVTKRLESKLPAGFSLNNTYLSATHTHNGAGGWAKGAAGIFLAGSFEEGYVQKMVEAIAKSISSASLNMEDALIGTARFNAFYLVKNRLVNRDEVDPWLRVLKVKKASGATAVLSTFSAHPTCISSKIDLISRDYPGALVDSLEKSGKVEFASFMAGAVGSHAPRNYNMSNFNLIGFIGNQLSYKILSSIDTLSVFKPSIIKTLNIPLSLREPHFKVTNSIRLRPWVFEWLLGKYTFVMKALRIDNIVFVGTPCDFSGTMVDSIDEFSSAKNYQVFVTSFNGGYLGYITEDRYYNLQKGETKDMNWFGPYNGAYFLEIIQSIIAKI
ncbi:MAG TPA: neutral/alkaline non-lysosomal ceramidase N-terminal domain-containing protein [Cytophagales bacterium]|nr:neutral/alkaline non-lysosomal ceramidase N-terminal domain-containing protein [Cytophagales bacterium]